MRRSRLRTWGLWLAAAAVAATVSLTVLVRSGRVHGWLHQIALAQLTSVLNARVEIAGLSGSLLGDVTVHGLRIVQDGDVVIEVTAVRADYSLRHLVFGRLVFDSVHLTRPRVRLVQSASGWNLARLARSRPSDPVGVLPAITLNDVRIDDGTIVVETPSIETVQLDHLAWRGRLAMGLSGLTVATEDASFRDVASAVVVEHAQAKLTVTADGVALSGLRIVSPGLSLAGRITLVEGRPSSTDLRIDLSAWPVANMRHYAPAAAPLPPLSGVVQVRSTTDHGEAEWSISGQHAGQTTGTAHVALDADGRPGLIRGRVSLAAVDPSVVLARRDVVGSVNADVAFQSVVDAGDGAAFAVDYTIAAGPSHLAGYRVDRLDATGRAGPGHVRATASIRAYGATATATLSGALGGGAAVVVEASGAVAHLNLDDLPATLNAPNLSTDISADFTVGLQGDAWQATAVARPSRILTMTVAEGMAVTAASRGRGADVTVEGQIEQVPAEWLGARPDMVSQFGARIRAAATIGDLATPLSLASLSGSLAGTVEGRGAGDAPIVGEVDASLQSGIVEVRRLELHSPFALVTAAGRLVTTAGPVEAESSLRYSVDALDLAQLTVGGGTPLRGAAHSEGVIEGPATEWRVSGIFAGQQLGYAERASALAMTGQYRVSVPAAAWREAKGVLDAEGSFMKLDEYEIVHGTLSASYAEQLINLRTRLDQSARSIEVEGGIALLPESQEIQLREFTVAGHGEPWRLRPGSATVVRYGNDRIRISGAAFERGPERIDAEGTVVLADTADPESPGMKLTVTSVNVGDLFMLATGTPRVTGLADGTVELHGTIRNPLATVALRLLDGKIADVPFQSVRADVTLADRLAKVNVRLVETNGVAVEVTGIVPTDTRSNQVDLRVRSPLISLGVVQALTTAVSEVGGSAALDLHVSGALAALEVEGGLEVKDGRMRVTSSGVTYRDLQAQIRFDDGWAQVASASLSDSSGGTLDVVGRTGMRQAAEGRAVEFTIRADSFQVLENELGQVALDADLTMAGTLSAPRITGTATATQARIDVDTLLRQLGRAAPEPPVIDETPMPASAEAASLAVPATTQRAPVADTRPKPSTGLWAQAAINVDVRLPDNAVLRGRDLQLGSGSIGLGDINLTVGGTVGLRKEPGQSPVAVGAVEAVRGFYDFQGRRFTVTRGSALQFRGEQPINPRLDVTGEREVSGVTARVRVTGTARRPTLALSSQPPLDEGDVLALIVFNQPLSQLGASEQVNLLERASDLALGAVASTLTASIGSALDVDLFEIRAPTASEPGELSLGTQVGERIFVGFRQQFGSDDASRLSVEYRLTETLRLLTSFGQGADRARQARDSETAGVDLVYTIKY